MKVLKVLSYGIILKSQTTRSISLYYTFDNFVFHVFVDSLELTKRQKTCLFYGSPQIYLFYSFLVFVVAITTNTKKINQNK